MDLACRNIAGNNATGRGYSPFPDLYSWTDDAPSANPGSVAQRYRLDQQTECGIGPVVVSCAEVSRLRNTDIAAYVDASEIINPGVLADPGAIADREESRELDADSRFDHYAGSNSGAEEAEKSCADKRRRHPGASKER